jgi:hypothetical protein
MQLRFRFPLFAPLGNFSDDYRLSRRKITFSAFAKPHRFESGYLPALFLQLLQLSLF